MTNIPPAVVPEPPSWWDRNWKWALPVGCLSSLVIFLVAIGLFAYAIFGFVTSALKATDAYKNAMAAAQNNSAVVEALGKPISVGWLISGRFDLAGSSGSAEMSIPISGPKGSGTLFVVATKSAGVWTYKTLAAEIDKTKQRIELEPPK
jgi:Cytochrome oxidase complex assembly protein 1